MPLKNPNRTPPGGFQYFVPQIGPNGWHLPNPMGHTIGSATKEVLKQFLANPRFPFPHDSNIVRAMIDEAQCVRLKYDRSWCVPVTGSEPKKSPSTSEVPPSNVPRPQSGGVRRAVAQLAAKAGKIASGIRILFDWWGDGGRPVKQVIAETRARTCENCPCNQLGDWTTRVTGDIAEAILEQRRAKTELAMTVPNEDKIGTCSVCECHLPLKIWVPLFNIDHSAKSSTWNNLPSNCWMKVEAGHPIVVLPFHTGDFDQAKDLLEWMEELGGCPNNRGLLVAAAQVPETRRNELLEIAERVFAEVQVIATPRPLSKEKWPAASNYMFKRAAEHLQQFHSPFWWNEPDCIPLKSGWIDELEAEYYLGGKPFMGCVMPGKQGTPAHFMSGNAMYPSYAASILAPFLKLNPDCGPCDAWDVASGDVVCPQASNTLKFYNFWGKADQSPTIVLEFPPDKAENMLLYSAIPQSAVSFHRCKDGSLIRLLSKKKLEILDSPITVVLTNFQRANLVWRAFESALNGGVKNIVVSSSGTNAALEEVHDRMRKTCSSVIIDAIKDDRGCNEMWLRGILRAKSPWIHILHDDDMILPAFKELERHITPQAGFLHWCGEVRTFETNVPKGSVINYFPKLPDGLHSTRYFSEVLMQPGTYAVSPVLGLFQRSQAIEALRECATLQEHFMLRPNMMVGNDTLLWMRIVERNSQFQLIGRPIIAFGCWTGSTTWDDMANKRGKLLPIYENMRAYFSDNPRYYSKIIHCVERHKESNPQYTSRKMAALCSWNQLYRDGFVPAHYRDYQRDSRLIGDERGLPYLKDVLAFGMAMARDNDILVLTNDDTILHPEIGGMLRTVLQRQPATMSHRCGYKLLSPNQYSLGAPLFKFTYDGGGRDLFAFRKSWLIEHWEEIPDMLLGSPWWDTFMGCLIRKSLGYKGEKLGLNNECWEGELPPGYVAHISHHSDWWKKDQSGGAAAHVYNVTLARDHLLPMFPGKTLDQLRVI